jgi:hypothetical protein
MASHSLAAAKRLRKELQQLERSAPDEFVHLRPSSDTSILKWKALLLGPQDTPYEGGVFELKIDCGTEYPLAPPKIHFVTKVSCDNAFPIFDSFVAWLNITSAIVLTVPCFSSSSSLDFSSQHSFSDWSSMS